MVLNDATLVLNKHWVPVDFTTVLDALCKMYAGSARAIKPDDFSVHDFDSWTSLRVAEEEPCIRTVSLRIKVPEVVLLTRYDSFPKHRVTFSRKNIFRRDKYTCQYCGHRPPLDELSVDHVVPRSRGGISSWSNYVLSCLRCNRRKGNRIADEAGMRLVHSPSEPAWTPCITIPLRKRKTSWQQFISREYWNVELET